MLHVNRLITRTWCTVYGFCGRKATPQQQQLSELRSCVKVEVAVLGCPSPIVPMVSVDVKQDLKKKTKQREAYRLYLTLGYFCVNNLKCNCTLSRTFKHKNKCLQAIVQTIWGWIIYWCRCYRLRSCEIQKNTKKLGLGYFCTHILLEVVWQTVGSCHCPARLCVDCVSRCLAVTLSVHHTLLVNSTTAPVSRCCHDWPALMKLLHTTCVLWLTEVTSSGLLTCRTCSWANRVTRRHDDESKRYFG